MQTLGLFLSSFILQMLERFCLMFLKPCFNKGKVGQIRWLLEPLATPTDYAWGESDASKVQG